MYGVTIKVIEANRVQHVHHLQGDPEIGPKHVMDKIKH
jgi:hypothetical protein